MAEPDAPRGRSAAVAVAFFTAAGACYYTWTRYPDLLVFAIVSSVVGLAFFALLWR